MPRCEPRAKALGRVRRVNCYDEFANSGKLNIFPSLGPMAEWLRRGLQILARRFDSGSGLHPHRFSEISGMRFDRWRRATPYALFRVDSAVVTVNIFEGLARAGERHWRRSDFCRSSPPSQRNSLHSHLVPQPPRPRPWKGGGSALGRAPRCSSSRRMCFLQ
jgi:hypothetical protein